MSEYIFRREDDGSLVRVDFETMMTMDSLGYIQLPEGVSARRCRHLEIESAPKAIEKIRELEKPILSDGLGFGRQQLGEFEADRKAAGFTGVEFVQDTAVPEFYQVKISSKREWQRYLEHRGMHDKNSRNGGSVEITEETLEQARQRILEKYPVLPVDDQQT